MMINKEYETFNFTQLNNNIKDSITLINLLIIGKYPIDYKLSINRFNGIII
jgi:hypothetical protein